MFRSQTNFFIFYGQNSSSQFDRNVRMYSLVNTVTASFNTIMGQMTEMSQRKNQSWKRSSIWNELVWDRYFRLSLCPI